ncbi:hypothetical protein ACSSS7_007959 [Eimeria intestinalis]
MVTTKTKSSVCTTPVCLLDSPPPNPPPRGPQGVDNLEEGRIHAAAPAAPAAAAAAGRFLDDQQQQQQEDSLVINSKRRGSSSSSSSSRSYRWQQQQQEERQQQQAREGESLAEWFVAECLTPAFFTNVWERRHFVWRGDTLTNNCITANLIDPGLFAEMLCRVWVAGNLALFKEGAPVQIDAPPPLPEVGGSLYPEEGGPPHHVWGALLRPYLSSASYILNQADRGLPLLSGFCRKLADLLFFHVFAVGYLTPPKSFTVNAHTDAQDVLLLQLWGCKEWAVYGSPRGLCLSSEMLGKKGPIEEGAAAGVAVVVAPAAATATADACVGPRAPDHIHFERGRCFVHPEREKGRLANGSEGEEERREATKAMIDALTKHLSYDSLLAASDAHAADLREMQDTQFAAAQRTAAKPPLRWQSIVRLAEGIECSCTDGAAEAIFRKGSATLRLPICHSASRLIWALSRGQKHQVSNLPCVDPFERYCVCIVLLCKGLLNVEVY